MDLIPENSSSATNHHHHHHHQQQPINLNIQSGSRVLISGLPADVTGVNINMRRKETKTKKQSDRFMA
jgi:hypothetical protein